MPNRRDFVQQSATVFGAMALGPLARLPHLNPAHGPPLIEPEQPTPLNILIGGATCAMPPILGWAAVKNVFSPESLILFLIIFAWTPPHFWALALYRREEYAKSGLPMLPVTHGEEFTRLHILLYTIILVAVKLPKGISGTATRLMVYSRRCRRVNSSPCVTGSMGRPDLAYSSRR